MYRVGLNTAIARYRKDRNKIATVGMEYLQQDIAYEDDFDREEQLRSMYKAISRLSDVEKAIVMLYLEDKSYDEIENILGNAAETFVLK